MPYKIVQTKENDKIILTIVPSKWESSGTLFWPFHRNEVKLIHNEESAPKTDWKKIQCIKKREYLTYREAERELEIMEQASDTDTEAASFMCKSRQKSRPLHNTRVLQPIDLNDQILYQNPVANIQAAPEDYAIESNIEPMVITIRRDSEQVLPSTSKNDIHIANNIPKNDIHIANNIPQVVNLGHNFDTNRCDSKSSNATESNSDVYISVTQNQILAQLLENQEKIMSQLACLQASVDFLMGANMSKKASEQPLNRLSIQPINSKNDFDELEAKLKDKAFYDKLVTELTFICGNSGKCKGVDSCYKLVDYFFTREIFLNCNWTGSTRDSTAEKKIPVKYYSRIRNCFFDIIRQSDTNFTENDADKFFKVIIKNAKPRLQNKIHSVARTCKSRVKKLQNNNGRNLEQPQGNGNDESPGPQQIPHEEAINEPLQSNERAEDNLNGGVENEREVVQRAEDNLNGGVENEREVVQNNQRD